ncbi:hypothetical protein Tco_1234317, partial [Tanacetum coccineum]
RQKIPESSRGSPNPVGDEDGSVKRFLARDEGRDMDVE